MNWQLASMAVLAAVFSTLAFRWTVPWALYVGWVDHPSTRRRHPRPTPVVGGLTILTGWYLAIGGYLFLNPDWRLAHGSSLYPILAAALLFSLLGLADDRFGLSARLRLVIEFVVVAALLVCVPELHSFCLQWQERVGLLVWPAVAVWMVGLANALNLVDGLDGLAGGISLLSGGSLLVLSLRFGAASDLSSIILALLIPCVAGFLVYNWTPARVFLGDNGSLPIGLLLATASLIGPIQGRSVGQVGSLLLMMGYPMLDMGLCTLRRIRHKNKIFKADRGHLHHRLQRMGLSVSQVVRVILSLTLYLQLCAFCLIEFMRASSIQRSPELHRTSLIFMVLVCFSLLYLFYLLRLTEQTRISRVSRRHSDQIGRTREGYPRLQNCMIARVNVGPLFESGLFEERERLRDVVSSLNLMIESAVGKRDAVFMQEQTLHIVFFDLRPTDENRRQVEAMLYRKLAGFQALFDIQYATSELKVTFEHRDFYLNDGANLPLLSPEIWSEVPMSARASRVANS